MLIVRNERKGWLNSLVRDGDNYSQINQHEAAVIWFLNHKVSNITKAYEKAKEVESARERRTIEKTWARLEPKKATIGAPEIISKEAFKQEFGVDDRQMQELITENEGLLKEYLELQDSISTAQNSINEIARLQTTLQEQLIYQSAQIDRLFDDAVVTMDTVNKANAQLNKAASNQSTTVRIFLYFVLFATILLLLLHFISD